MIASDLFLCIPPSRSLATSAVLAPHRGTNFVRWPHFDDGGVRRSLSLALVGSTIDERCLCVLRAMLRARARCSASVRRAAMVSGGVSVALDGGACSKERIRCLCCHRCGSDSVAVAMWPRAGVPPKCHHGSDIFCARFR